MTPTFAMPVTFYIVARQFKELGLGSGGDITDDFDQACQQFLDAETDSEPARVFLIEMDDKGWFPRYVADVTSDAVGRIAEWNKGREQ